MGVSTVWGIIKFIIANWGILQQLYSELIALVNSHPAASPEACHSALGCVIDQIKPQSPPVTENAPVSTLPSRGRILGGILGRILRRRK